MSTRVKTTDLTHLFAALADRTQLRLLNLIAGREVCVCYPVEILRQGQPKISRHLAYLRKTGVVAARREGKWMHCRLEGHGDAATASILDAVFQSFKSDREMQSDLTRLSRASCEPERFVSLKGRRCRLNLRLPWFEPLRSERPLRPFGRSNRGSVKTAVRLLTP